jgi:protein-S-isoprenylcysteine O-methyltransferase Ste14
MAAVLKTLLVAVLLIVVFLVGIPMLILRATSGGWSQLPRGGALWLGIIPIVFGAYLYLWSVIRLLRRGTSAVPGQAPSVLEVGGWYGRVRHPLLLGVVLILLGEALLFSSLALLGYALAYALWLHAFVVLKEEPDLRRAFGERYDEYCREVPRWIPRVLGKRS